MCEEKQDGSVLRALAERHCSRLATTASTAAAAVAELEPPGPVGEKAIAGAAAVFDEVRYIFEALAKRSEEGLRTGVSGGAQGAADVLRHPGGLQRRGARVP